MGQLSNRNKILFNVHKRSQRVSKGLSSKCDSESAPTLNKYKWNQCLKYIYTKAIQKVKNILPYQDIL